MKERSLMKTLQMIPNAKADCVKKLHLKAETVRRLVLNVIHVICKFRYAEG